MRNYTQFQRTLEYTDAQMEHATRIDEDHTKIELALAIVNIEGAPDGDLNKRFRQLVRLEKRILAHSIARHASNGEVEIPTVPRGTRVEDINLSTQVVENGDPNPSNFEVQLINEDGELLNHDEIVDVSSHKGEPDAFPWVYTLAIVVLVGIALAIIF